jgi:hypothetical protein
MRSEFATIIGLVTVFGYIASAFGADAGSGGAGMMILERRTLKDRTTQLDVATLLIPKSWTLDEQILWRLDRGQFVCNASTIADPKSGAVIRWLPMDQFNASPVLAVNARQQGVPLISGGLELCDGVPTPDQFLTQIVIPRYRNERNLKVVDAKDMLPFAQAVKQHRAVEVAAAQQAGYVIKYGAAKVRIEYTSATGAAMEEDVYLVMTLAWNEAANANVRNMGMANAESYLFYPERVYSFAAPKGKLDAMTPLFQTIVGSLRPTLRWDAYVARLNQIRQQGVIERGIMDRVAREEITASQQQTWNQRLASEDRIAEGVGDILRGVQRYNEPTEQGKEVMLPDSYRRAFSNGQGQYIVTDDPSFNPLTTPNLEGNWQEMSAKK